MSTRQNAAVCWRADAPQVNPPRLPGSLDVCSWCKAKVFISNRTRGVIAEHPGMVIICNVCARNFKGSKTILYPTDTQRREIGSMGVDTEN